MKARSGELHCRCIVTEGAPVGANKNHQVNKNFSGCTVCLYNVTEEIKIWWEGQTLAVHCLLTLLLPWHFLTLFIASFITLEATGDGKSSQQRVVEVTTLHLTGVHLTFASNLCDIPPLADIWANLPTGLTNNWDSRRDLDTGLWHPLIPLSPPLPDVWHPVIFLWPFHAPTTTLPLCALLSDFNPTYSAMCNVCPRSESRKHFIPISFAAILHILNGWPGSSPHVWPSLTHCCTVADSPNHLPESVHAPAVLTHTVLFLVFCIISQNTKTYQVTIWGRLSPTDINVGTWIFWGSWRG